MQITSSKSTSSLATVYQKDCVISKSKKMVTGSIGGCYVLAGHDPKTKYSFMAHLDDTTNVEGISKIFSTLKELGVNSDDLTGVRLIGGYKDQDESKKWGNKIIEVLEKEGIGGKVDYNYFQKKLPPELATSGNNTHFFGAHLDPQTGTFSFLQNLWFRI